MKHITKDMNPEQVARIATETRAKAHEALSSSPGGEIVPAPQPPDPMALVAAAIERGMDPQKILDFIDRINATKAAEQFHAAIAKFQAHCPRVLKERAVHTKDGRPMYQFAAYDDIKRLVQPLLVECGIVTTFTTNPQVVNGQLVGTIRVRVGSHCEETSLPLPIPQGMNTNKAQDFGAAVTYLKRYLFCAALDIVTTDERDDDGASLAEFIDAEQIETLKTLIKSSGTDMKSFLDWAGIGVPGGCPSLDKMLRSKYLDAVGLFGKKVSK